MPAPPAGAVTPVASVPSCAAPAGSGSAAAETGTVPFTLTVGVPVMPTFHVPLWLTDCVAANATGTGLVALIGVATPDATVMPKCATTVLPLLSLTGVEIGTLVVPSRPLTTEKLLPAEAA